MCALRSPAWRVGFARGLRAMAVWWGAVVDRSEVCVVIGAAAERRDDVVDGVCSGLVADVTDPAVPPQYLRAKALPVPWQRGASVSSHAWIVLQADRFR